MSAPAAPAVSVIIPHYNDTTRLRRCLDALAAQDRSGIEVVLADNASTEDLSWVAAEFGFVQQVTQPQKGAAAARNAGVAISTAPVLAFLDADCVPEADWLDQVRALGVPEAVIGGQIGVFDETPAPRSGAEAFETVFAFDQAGYIRDKGFSVTANLVTTRAVFDHVGPFVVGVSEDLDWCHRARAQGYGLRYAPDLSVRHPTRSDWPALRHKWVRLTAEAFGLTGAGGAARALWGLRAVMMPASIVAHAPRIWRHSALKGGERWRATGVLIRLRLARMGWMLRQALLGR